MIRQCITAILLLLLGTNAFAVEAVLVETNHFDELTPPDDLKQAAENIQKGIVFSQMPVSPRLYDSPDTISCGGTPRTVAELPVWWVEPQGGVTSATGLIIRLNGIGSIGDCQPGFAYFPSIAEDRNNLWATVHYRNAGFFPPYDFGKYQVIDVLRATGYMLQRYPQLDRRRIYLYGVSGGGHVALQTLLASRHLWAEVHAMNPITRISVREDVLNNGYDRDPFNGWNTNLGWPTSQGSLDPVVWRRYQAERALRSPVLAYRTDPVFDANDSGILPRLYMTHGTADAVVDFQHFLDFTAAVTAGAGVEPLEPGPTFWRRGNWRFWASPGFGHGAFTVDWTVANIPEAFTTSRSTDAIEQVEYRFPPQQGLTYEITGPLLHATLRVVDEATSPTLWMTTGE